ncbi:UTRA domain-containing protein [Neptuniibacter sp. 2_MG-2023]|jgi:DNA-binding GntR family transcriptional regulator|uniref:UTRA domain-containing protein n=1 Tax=Neptuniibacter sp. 2_MG-2023 TaxID=3062671 RepID=UPI0026E11DC6|nr:UTRA domain-containing protein [Neptuniibacter sp. 2_MG-2023]MDO6513572.1 UTRA domain-containing protein [Neptuniibacter sp. 2_MG-2023]
MTIRKSVSSASVVTYLRNCIKKGDLNPDDKLPSEREISERLKTTRVTTREGLKQLEAQGLIYRSNRRGWFVTPERINYDPSRAIYFMDYVSEQGQIPFSREILKRKIVADAFLAEAMKIDLGEPVVELHRLRGANNRPVYFERIYLREAILPGVFDKPLERSVSRVVRDEYQTDYDQVDLNIIVGSLDEYEAELLQAPAGYTSIEIQRLSYDQDGHVIEFDVEHWRHDALQLKVNLSAH